MGLVNHVHHACSHMGSSFDLSFVSLTPLSVFSWALLGLSEPRIPRPSERGMLDPFSLFLDSGPIGLNFPSVTCSSSILLDYVNWTSFLLLLCIRLALVERNPNFVLKSLTRW